MADFKNEFSWSKSRAEKFNKCLRSYYLHYYGSWGGWDWEAKPEHKEIYVMKNLQSIPLWVGSIVHETVEWLTKRAATRDPVPIDQALDRLRKNMDMDWWTSESGNFRDQPNKMVGLMEHYYGEPIDQETFETAVTQSQDCIQNLYQNSVYQQFAGNQNLKILATEPYDSMNMNGLKVWAVPDVVTWDGTNLHLIDWKTGKAMGGDEINFQLSIYTAYCSIKWEVLFEKITASEVNLFLNQVKTRTFTVEDIQETKQAISVSASKMLDMLVDPENNIAREDDFPMTEILNYCRYCNFKRACGRE